MPVKYGFLGPAGTFSEEALLSYVRGQEAVIPVPYSNISEVLTAVSSGEVEAGVVPYANSLAGSVGETMDALAEAENLLIMGEIVLPVRHNLLTPANIELGAITQVFSHPQALEQCRKFLNSCLGKAALTPACSTGEAARIVAGSGKPWAAIGTLRAGELYGLVPLRRSIEDNHENITRFWLAGKKEMEPTGSDKTTVVFMVGRQPGQLYEILGCFAKENINLLRIESRPDRQRIGEYLIFIDLEGHRQETRFVKALSAVSQAGLRMRVLGSYPECEFKF